MEINYRKYFGLLKPQIIVKNETFACENKYSNANISGIMVYTMASNNAVFLLNAACRYSLATNIHVHVQQKLLFTTTPWCSKNRS